MSVAKRKQKNTEIEQRKQKQREKDLKKKQMRDQLPAKHGKKWESTHNSVLANLHFAYIIFFSTVRMEHEKDKLKACVDE